jgi:hypothetical protein
MRRVPTPLVGLSFPREIHEGVTHGTAGDSKEVPPILPVDLMGIRQPQERLVNERRGLEQIAGSSPTHVLRRLLSKLTIENRGHLPIRVLVARMPGPQQNGDVAAIPAQAVPRIARIDSILVPDPIFRFMK